MRLAELVAYIVVLNGLCVWHGYRYPALSMFHHEGIVKLRAALR